MKNFIHESEYRCTGYDERNSLPHYDNSIEILQFWSEGGYFIARNNIFPILPGSIIVINAMETHYSNPTSLNRYTRNKLILSTECFHHICTLCNLSDFSEKIYSTGGIQLCISPTSSDALHIDLLFKKAAARFTHDSYASTSQAEIISCVIQILAAIINSDCHVHEDCSKQLIHQMTSYINKHLQSWEEISLQNLCEHLHISSSYASHLFKQLTNKSITQYSNDLRISEAKKLLLTTDLKIYDIAETLKFKDSTTFCKTFKKYTQVSPKCYRQSNGKLIF